MVFLDFDGTLVDIWPRFYAAFCELSDAVRLTLEEYRSVKRRLVRDEAIADYLHVHLRENYFQRKKVLLESKRLLKLDRLLLDSDRLNAIIRKKGNILLLTKRRFPQNLAWELDALGLQMPAQVLRERSKAEWIQAHYPTEESVIIGDSVADLEAGNLPSVKAVMVSYGLGANESFSSAGIPFTLLETPMELYRYLQEL